MYTMTHYVWRHADGTVHVQNAVMGMLGQHHVHTVEDFKRWCEGGCNLDEMDGECTCSMKPGEMCNGAPS